MKIRPGRASLALVISLVAAVASIGILVSRPETVAKPALPCGGEYAEALQFLSPRVREIEQGPASQYSYLIRSTAIFECPYFGADGKLRRRRVHSTEYGTALAYEWSGNETFLLTNEHVAAWPDVTDDTAHRVEGVGPGCKRVEEKLRIVKDEHDDYEPGQIPLSRVAVDPVLDAAVLKSSVKLTVLPYRIGRSAALRQGNAVQVRGFPLGLLQAVNAGKVVNPYDHDQEQGWDHVDFVVDALLSEGNSGSPVLALSCKTGELELVGMYHAGYKGHSALNVVVGVDQLREFMQRKKRIPRAMAAGGSVGLGAAERDRLRAEIGASPLPLVELGGATVRLETLADGGFLYHVYRRRFPLDDRRASVLEDRPRDATFGEPGRLWFHGDLGWREWQAPNMGPDERDLVTRMLQAIRLQALRMFEYRRTLAHPTSAEERRRGRDIERDLDRREVVLRELVNSFLELTDRLGPGRDSPVAMAEAPPLPALPPVGAPAGSEGTRRGRTPRATTEEGR